MIIEPINQIKLYGLGKYLKELIKLYKNDNLPNKILLSGQKGLGKSTLAYHLINYILSQSENFPYDLKNFSINSENNSFKLTINKSNPNLSIIDLNDDKKFIDINQIRELISNLNKSSFNNKPRFVLIDNIEFLNTNSINALLKILEEPNFNIYFILINNNRKILSTLLSRCINYKISMTNIECLKVGEILLENRLEKRINKDLLNYYITPGIIYNLVKFSDNNKYDLVNLNLQQFLKVIIKENHYKKNHSIRYIFLDLLEFYFRKISFSFTNNINDKYSYFLKKISDTRKFNLDEDSLFLEFEDEILNG